jgi:hypothetical protein
MQQLTSVRSQEQTPDLGINLTFEESETQPCDRLFFENDFGGAIRVCGAVGE